MILINDKSTITRCSEIFFFFFLVHESVVTDSKEKHTHNLVLAGRLLSKSTLVFELHCGAVQTVQTFLGNICKKKKKAVINNGALTLLTKKNVLHEN